MFFAWWVTSIKRRSVRMQCTPLRAYLREVTWPAPRTVGRWLQSIDSRQSTVAVAANNQHPWISPCTIGYVLADLSAWWHLEDGHVCLLGRTCAGVPWTLSNECCCVHDAVRTFGIKSALRISFLWGTNPRRHKMILLTARAHKLPNLSPSDSTRGSISRVGVQQYQGRYPGVPGCLSQYDPNNQVLVPVTPKYMPYN